MVKTSPSYAGGAGSIPGWGAGIPHASRPKSKTWNRGNVLTNSVKTLKMVHIKKKIKKERKEMILLFINRKILEMGKEHHLGIRYSTF